MVLQEFLRRNRIMNTKHKGHLLSRAPGLFCAGLLALFLVTACDNPMDNNDQSAQDTPLSQDSVPDPPSDPPPLVSTVTFDNNGGTTEAEPREISLTWPDNTVELPVPPSRDDGLFFRGWNTKADGSGTKFTAGTEVSESITVYARWGAPFETMVTDVAEVADWLSAQSGGAKASPVNLVLDIDLGDMADGSPWYALLDALVKADKYVALDLSDCTMSGADENGTVFYPNYAYKGPTSMIATYTGGGKAYIVELTLPLSAKKIYGGWREAYTMTPIPAFVGFNNLAKIRGDNVEEAYAGPGAGHSTSAMFYGLSSLREARFEKLTKASYFFRNCTNLESVYCPSLTTIGYATFYGCKKLTSFNFSKVQKIEKSAFGGTGLVTLDLSQSTVTKIPGEDGSSNASFGTAIPAAAFKNCSNLETIVFPACFTNIGNYTYLAHPELLGGQTFAGCTKIREVTFLGDPANIDWLENGPPYATGLDDNLIKAALSGATPHDRIGTYVNTGTDWSKQ
jgi:hypothetical protein